MPRPSRASPGPASAPTISTMSTMRRGAFLERDAQSRAVASAVKTSFDPRPGPRQRFDGRRSVPSRWSASWAARLSRLCAAVQSALDHRAGEPSEDACRTPSDSTDFEPRRSTRARRRSLTKHSKHKKTGVLWASARVDVSRAGPSTRVVRGGGAGRSSGAAWIVRVRWRARCVSRRG